VDTLAMKAISDYYHIWTYASLGGYLGDEGCLFLTALSLGGHITSRDPSHLHDVILQVRLPRAELGAHSLTSLLLVSDTFRAGFLVTTQQGWLKVG